MYTTTCWDSGSFWQLYLARTAGFSRFKRRLATDGVSIVDIVSTFKSNCNSIREIVSLSQTRVIGASNSATRCVHRTRGIAIRNESESANTAERARFSHHSLLIVNASDSETRLADKSPGLEGFLSVRDFKSARWFGTGTVYIVLRLGDRGNQNRIKKG